ncbi:hypothetical protein QTP86_017117 [Hemibagrus guttatus]|nr:hypothetical protein QTP86_017117 [Hemibagrus guttatus]
MIDVPNVEISLPKVTPPKVDLNVEGPEIKGRKFHMQDINISLPKANIKGGVDLEGEVSERGMFQIPMVDLSLPRMKLAEGNTNVDSPDIKVGKVRMPSTDLSLPKGMGKGEIVIEGQALKRGKMDLPKFDISFPKVTPPKADISGIGPEIKDGQFHMPDIDISLPKVKVKGDVDLEGLTEKGTKFHMPKVDISIPKLKPSVDISAPKVDLDFGIPKQKCTDKEDIELLKGEGSRPSSGASFEIPDVTLKMPKISLPKFGGKFKTEDQQVEGLRLSTVLDVAMDKNMPSLELNGDEKMKGKRQKIKSKEDVNASLDIGAEGKEYFKVPILDTKTKVKMPSVEISLPTPYIPEREALLPKSEIDVSEADIKAYEGSLKIPKMPTIDISVPKVDLDFALPKAKQNAKFKLPDITNPPTDISLQKKEEGEIQVQEMDKEGWQKLKMSGNVNADAGLGSGLSLPKTDIKAPELDYGTVQDDTSDKMNTKPGTMVKIPKFGVALPSLTSPEAKVNVKSPKGSSLTTNPEIQYEGPPIPKVTKAVFVLVNSQTESYVHVTSKASAETVGKKIKMPKITDKQSFGKSHSKGKGTISEEEDEEEKMDEEVKTGAFRLPKLEFSSPYLKNVGEAETFEIGMEPENKGSTEVSHGTKSKSGKISFPGFKKKSVIGDEESKNGSLVSSKARLEMLKENQGFESPVPNISLGTNILEESESKDDVRNRKDVEEKEETAWFKIPKVTLSPHSTGILQIAPEGSPKKSKSSLQYSSEEISGVGWLCVSLSERGRYCAIDIRYRDSRALYYRDLMVV